MTEVSVLLLDASCLINLYATGVFREIALGLPYNLAVSDYVLEEEALYVWRSISGGEQNERVPVNLLPLVEEGLVTVLHLEHQEEEEIFINLAAYINDGEAITGALALYRGYGIAIDDRKARRVLAERNPTLPLFSTLELLKEGAERSPVEDEKLRSAIVAMQTGASYVPGEQDSLYEWWRAIVSGKTR